MHWRDLPAPVLSILRQGAVIPAHPLALDADRKFDKQSQRAISRYYVDAGSGGLAVGVHSTQFAIREVGLYRPVLELAIETARDWTDRPLVMIAGAVGKTAQAVEEARTARALGYHAVLLSLAALKGAQRGRADRALHGGREGDAAGRLLPADRGRRHPAVARLLARFAAIDNVVADQGRAVQPLPHARRRLRHRRMPHAEDRITLYTGNDDHIVADLVTPLVVRTGNREVTLRFQGGLLGHWSVWTRGAVKLLERLSCGLGRRRHARAAGARFVRHRLQLGGVRRRPRLRRLHPGLPRDPAAAGPDAVDPCLDPHETLSPGQSEGIDRLYATYPELHDDAFVAANLERWRN